MTGGGRAARAGADAAGRPTGARLKSGRGAGGAWSVMSKIREFYRLAVLRAVQAVLR